MATVHIPAPLVARSNRKFPVEVEGKTVRQIIDNLERIYPGIRDELVAEDRLRSGICVAIDGQISPLGLIERVAGNSQVQFLLAIAGG